MSASREKKQRQTDGSEEKVLTAAEQAAVTKRKTIQYTIIGVVIAVLVAALLFWDSGLIQRNSTAVTIGDTDYSAAEVNYYYNSLYQEIALYAQYGLNSYDTSRAPEDQVYSTDSETGEVTTYHDYFTDYAVKQLTTITALYNAAIAEGYTEADVSDVVTTEMETLAASASNNGYSSSKQMLVAYYGKLITPSIYRGIVARQALASKYLSDYTDSLKYSDSDLAAYYEANADTLDTIEYSYLYFKADTTEESDNKEEALADAKAKADEAAEMLKNGTSAADVVTATEPTSSSLENTTLGASVNANVSEWLLSSDRTSGDIEVVAYSDYGYYVAIFHNRYLDETPSVNVRHILVAAELDADAKEPTVKQMAEAKVRAEDLLSSWQTGEASEEAFAALANEHSTDTGSNTNGGLYENVFPGNFVTNFNNWLFNEGERKVGDVAILENNGDSNYYGYHVVYFSGINEGDFAWRNTARSALSNDDVTVWVEGLTAELTATKQSGINYIG